VQYGKLDIDYLKRWTKKLNVESLWKRLVDEAETPIIDVQQLTACAVGTADRSAISFTHKEIRYSVEITDLTQLCQKITWKQHR